VELWKNLAKIFQEARPQNGGKRTGLGEKDLKHKKGPVGTNIVMDGRVAGGLEIERPGKLVPDLL